MFHSVGCVEGRMGQPQALHEPCSVPTFRCILCRRKELLFSSLKLVMLQIMGCDRFSQDRRNYLWVSS